MPRTRSGACGGRRAGLRRAQFWTLRHVDAATYQILGNLKIVTTGLLLWACLRRPLSLLQALALLLLMIGATISQARRAARQPTEGPQPRAGRTMRAGSSRGWHAPLARSRLAC